MKRHCQLCGKRRARSRLCYHDGLTRDVCLPCLNDVRKEVTPQRQVVLWSGKDRLFDLPLYQIVPPVDPTLFTES